MSENGTRVLQTFLIVAILLLGGSAAASGSTSPASLSSSSRFDDNPSGESNGMGFRVASLSSSAPPAVPEPSMMVIGTLFGLGGLMAKRRMNK